MTESEPWVTHALNQGTIEYWAPELVKQVVMRDDENSDQGAESEVTMSKKSDVWAFATSIHVRFLGIIRCTYSR